MESCCMSIIIDSGLCPNRALTKWVQNLEVLLHDIGGPEQCAICVTQSFCKVRLDLRLGYLAPN